MFDLQRNLSIVDFQRSTSNAQPAVGRRGDLRLRLPANALELLECRQWIVAEMVAHEQRRLRQYIQGDEAVGRTARVQLAYLLGRHGRWQREHRATRERLFLR